MLKKICLILICILSLLFIGCTMLNNNSAPEIIGKKMVLTKNLDIAKNNKKFTFSKKEPVYFLLTSNIIIPKINYNIIGTIKKGTFLIIKNIYSYTINFENGISFNNTEILNGEYKGLIINASNLIENYWDKKTQKWQTIFNPAYAVEATPENIAKIEKDIEEENQRK
jgi:hypothetical protein